MRDISEGLEQETSFWREMLKECLDTDTSDCQRMREALLLAEFKLAQMTELYH